MDFTSVLSGPETDGLLNPTLVYLFPNIISFRQSALSEFAACSCISSCFWYLQCVLLGCLSICIKLQGFEFSGPQ